MKPLLSLFLLLALAACSTHGVTADNPHPQSARHAQ